MAYSTTITISDGTTDTFTFPFPYNHPDDIVVTVGGVVTPFTFGGSNLVILPSTPANGVEVKISRETPIDVPEVIFSAPGALSPSLLNRNTDQILFAVQEVADDNENTREILDRRSSIGDTPPLNPEAGDQWFDTTTATMFIYYVDGDSQQWVETNNANPGPGGGGGGVGSVGPTGPAGPTGATGAAGANGAAGAVGPTGPAGATGAAGPTGATGATGSAGSSGTIVAVGTTAPSTPATGDLWVDTN